MIGLFRMLMNYMWNQQSLSPSLLKQSLREKPRNGDDKMYPKQAQISHMKISKLLAARILSKSLVI